MDIFSSRRDDHPHLITVHGGVHLTAAGELLPRLQPPAIPASGVITADLSQITSMNGAGLAPTPCDVHRLPRIAALGGSRGAWSSTTA